MGMSTAILTVASRAFVKPLPYPGPDELVSLRQQSSDGEFSSYVGAEDLKALQLAARTLEIGAYIRHDANFGRGNDSVRCKCGAVTASLFRVVGVHAIRGRLFEDEDDKSGAARVAVLSYDFWLAKFGGEDSVLGREMLLDGELHRIVGVLPAGFRLVNSEGDHFDAWVAGALDGQRWGARPIVIVHSIGRFRPGIGVAQTNAELRGLKSLQKRRPHVIAAVSWPEEVRRLMRAPVLMILAVIGIILLISCANAANLLLSRAIGRQQEITLRSALGGGRGRIIRQLLTESVVLSSISALIGLALSFFAKDLLLAYISSRVPVLGPVEMNYTALAYTFALGIGTGLLFGLVPALQITRQRSAPLNVGGRGSATFGSLRLRRAVVIGEVALSVVSVVAAGLLLRSLMRLQQVDCGYNPARVAVGTVDLDPVLYRTPERQAAFAERVRLGITGSAGVLSAAVSSQVPLGGWIYSVGGLEIEGQSRVAGRSLVAAVSPAFFDTLGIPLRAGRDFANSDRQGAPDVAIVNRAFGRLYCKESDCVGRRIAHWQRKGVWMVIVGMVADTRFSAEDSAEPEVYRPIAQEGASHQEFVIKMRGSAGEAVEVTRHAVAGVDSSQPLHDMSTLDLRQAKFMAPRRVMLTLVGLLGILALALALIGTVGMLQQSVVEQRRAIAIRMAIGAAPLQMMRWQMTEGLALIGSGMLIGSLISMGTARWIQSELWGVSTNDPLTWMVALAAIGISSCGACFMPAVAASRVQIALILRGE
jgi:putative ABC transport system permease protein